MNGQVIQFWLIVYKKKPVRDVSQKSFTVLVKRIDMFWSYFHIKILILRNQQIFDLLTQKEAILLAGDLYGRKFLWKT